MRSGMLTAVFALLLIGSFSGCSTTANYPGNDTDNLTASDRSSLERNGVHDGTADDRWDGRTASDPYYRGSPNQSLNSPNGKTLNRDIQNTGEKVIGGTEDIANDAKNGLRDAGQNAANGMREAGRDIQQGITQAERDARNLMGQKR